MLSLVIDFIYYQYFFEFDFFELFIFIKKKRIQVLKIIKIKYLM